MLPDGFQTARLIARPIAAGDRDAIFESYAQDAEVTRYLTWRPHRGRDDTASYIAHCLEIPPTVARTYVLTDRDDGAIRGAIDLRLAAAHRIEVGYVLGRRWWGQGLMTEILAAVADWALRQDDVFRISAVCDVENIASARVLEKAGLVREGLLRRYLLHPGVSDAPRDCFSYARVR